MHWKSLAVAIAALPIASAAGAGQRTYINPIDLDYRYNFEQINEGVSYRTAADPAVVNYHGAYYLFLTLADGYWRSTDLIHWTFVTPEPLGVRRNCRAGRLGRRESPHPDAVHVVHSARLNPRHHRARNRQA